MVENQEIITKNSEVTRIMKQTLNQIMLYAYATNLGCIIYGTLWYSITALSSIPSLLSKYLKQRERKS